MWLEELFTSILLYCLHCTWQSKKPTQQQQPSCDFFCQFHSSVQFLTLDLGWLRLIGGQYVFALRGHLVELELPDGIAFATVWSCLMAIMFSSLSLPSLFSQAKKIQLFLRYNLIYLPCHSQETEKVWLKICVY